MDWAGQLPSLVIVRCCPSERFGAVRGVFFEAIQSGQIAWD
jgi:hypothetical protein